MKWRVKLLALIAALLTGCASTPTSNPSPLLGMVYNTDREPISDVTVRLMNGKDELQKTLTDIRGRFNLSKVPFGMVTLEFTKDTYEPVVWTLRFQNAAQVVYMRLENSAELLDDAQTAIDKGDWDTASGLLDRVDKLVSHSRETRYLRGVMLSAQGKAADAAALLEGLSSEGSPSFAVEMTLADLYQYKLDDPAKTREHLKRALSLKRDIDVEKRLADLPEASSQ